MNWLAALLFIFLPELAIASYKIIPDQVLITENTLKDIDRYFVTEGYDVFSNRVDFVFMPEIDRLYVKYKSNEKVFLKVNAYLESRDHKKSVPFKNGYIVNFASKNTHSVIYFSGFDQSKIQNIKSGLKKELAARSVWYSLFMKSAQADVSVCNNKILKKDAAVFEDKNRFVRSTWGCIKGVGTTTWNFTGGMIHDLAKLGWNVSKNSSILLYCSLPIRKHEVSCTEWKDEIFSAAEKNFSDITKMIQNTGQTVKQLYPAYAGLDSVKQGAIACEIISTLGISTALMIGTGGIGTQSAAIKIHQVMEKLKQTSLKVPKNFESQLDREAILRIANRLNQIDSVKAKELFDSHTAYTDKFRSAVNAKINSVELTYELEKFKDLSSRVRRNPELLKTLDVDEKEFLNVNLLHYQGLVKQAKAAGDLYIVEKVSRDKLLAKAHAKAYEAENLIDQSTFSKAEKLAIKAELAAVNCAMVDNSVEKLVVPARKKQPSANGENVN